MLDKILEPVKKAVEDSRATIATSSKQERFAIDKINRLSEKDIRGKTPDVSKQIRELDKARRDAVTKRREATQEVG